MVYQRSFTSLNSTLILDIHCWYPMHSLRLAPQWFTFTSSVDGRTCTCTSNVTLGSIITQRRKPFFKLMNVIGYKDLLLTPLQFRAVANSITSMQAPSSTSILTHTFTDAWKNRGNMARVHGKFMVIRKCCEFMVTSVTSEKDQIVNCLPLFESIASSLHTALAVHTAIQSALVINFDHIHS